MSKIPWCDVTVNPFPGCWHVSSGCNHCYAERQARRLKAMGHPQYQAVLGADGKWTGQVGRNLDAMKVPGKGKRVFVESMGDLFYEKIDGFDIHQVVASIKNQPKHTFQILTKRIERAAKYFVAYNDDLPANAWLGVTAEDQEWADRRIPILLQIPAVVRFVSLEPLLGSVDLTRLHVDWVIVGCESGPKRRPCEMRWIANIVRYCHAVGLPVFVKQISIDGQVERRSERIVTELHKHIGPLSVEDVQQWPRGANDV